MLDTIIALPKYKNIPESEFNKWSISPELLNNYETAEDEKLKEVLKTCIQNSIYLKKRMEKAIISEEEIKKQCNPECESYIRYHDPDGYFIGKCPKINESYCLITEDQKKKLKNEKELLEVFKPYQVPILYKNAILKKVNTSIRYIIEKYLSTIESNLTIKKGLSISGNIGSGKTSILYLIIKEVIESKYKIYYSTINDVYKYLIRNNEEYLAYLFHADLLLIDDLGREYNQVETVGFGYTQFEDLIDYRYRECKTTFITSNLKFNGLGSIEEKYQRIYSRLKETTQFISIVCEDKRVPNWKD